MNEAVQSMLKKYRCQSVEDYTQALKEIIQEIALLGLWRAKFFEKAAFYGGTALRLLYGLDRFSEDLDFSLLKPDRRFDIAQYETALVAELKAFGFEVTVGKKAKSQKSNIESAFIKTDTLIHLLKIRGDLGDLINVHRHSLLKVKLEVDTNPPPHFVTEVKYLFQPIPFSVKAFTLPNLFAGKLHALLCRGDRQNIKGRDWYDFLWYVSRGVPVHLKHLTSRMRQSGHWKSKKALSLELLRQSLEEKIRSLEFKKVKKDVENLVTKPSDLKAWSPEIFLAATERLACEA